jgi:hypothetical protein
MSKACCNHFSVTNGTCDRCGAIFGKTYNFISIAVERRLRRQEFERILYLADYAPGACREAPAWQ